MRRAMAQMQGMTLDGGHGHSHGGAPCDGNHGPRAPAAHGHSHGGAPCDGNHGHSHAQHAHSHEGGVCADDADLD